MYMYSYLRKARNIFNFSKKQLRALFMLILMGGTGCAWGYDYIWTGNGGDKLWTNTANWEGGQGYPNGGPSGDNDTATFPNGTEVNLDIDIEVTTLTISGGSVTINLNNHNLKTRDLYLKSASGKATEDITFSIKDETDTKKLEVTRYLDIPNNLDNHTYTINLSKTTLDVATTTYFNNDTDNKGTVAITGDGTFNSNSINHNNTTLNIADTITTNQLDTAVHDSGSWTPALDPAFIKYIEIKDSYEIDSTELAAISKLSKLQKISVDSTGKLTLSTPISINIELENNGELIMTTLPTGTGNITVSGKLTTNFSNEATLKNIKIDGTNAEIVNSSENLLTLSNVTYGGNNLSVTGNISLPGTASGDSIGTLTARGSSLTLAGNITVTDLDLQGSSETSRLSISGSGKKIKLADAPSGKGRFLSIAEDIYITKVDSEADGINFYYETEASVPATNPTDNSQIAKIIKNGWRIAPLSELKYTWTGAATSEEDKTKWNVAANWDIGITPVTGSVVEIPENSYEKYPVVTDSIELKSLKIGKSNPSTASLTLGANPIKCTGETDAFINYGNLILTDSGRIKKSDTPINDTEHGTVTYAGNGTDGTITDFSDGDNADYYNLVISSGTWKNAGSIKTNSFSATGGSVYLGTSNINNFNVAKGLSISGNTTFFTAGEITASSITLGKQFTLEADTTFGTSTAASSITLDYDFTNENPISTAGNKLIFNSTIDGGKSFVTTGEGTVTFNNTVGSTTPLSSIYIAGPVVINTTEIKTSGTQTYENAITLASDTKLTAKTVTFDGNVNGEKALAITGDSIFKGTVGYSQPLTSLSVSKNTKIVATAITSSSNQTYSGAVTVSSEAILKATGTDSSITFSDSIIGSKKLTVDAKAKFTNTAATVSNSEIHFMNTVEGTSTVLTIQNTQAAKFDSNITLKNLILNSPTILNEKVEVSTPVENKNNLTVGNNVVFKLPYTSTGTSAALNAPLGNITFESSLDFTNTKFNANNGTVTIRPITNPASNTLPIINVPAENANFYNLKIEYTTSDETKNTYKTLLITAGDTLVVKGKLTIKGEKLTTPSTSPEHSKSLILLSTEESSQWYITAAEHDISNVEVQNSENMTQNSAGKYTRLYAVNSIDLGKNIRWDFPGFTYKWEGTVSTNWFSPLNWKPDTVPGINSNVEIIKTDGITKFFPILTNDLNITEDYAHNSLGRESILTVDSDAQLNLDSYSITVREIKNNGRIILKGSQSIYTSQQPDVFISDNNIINSTTSTVEYNGDFTNQHIPLGTKYNNIEFTSGATGTNDGDGYTPIEISGTTLIDNGATLPLTINGTFTGPVTIADSAPAVTPGHITLKSASEIQIAANAKANSLIVNGPANLYGNVETTNSQTYNGSVKLSGDSELTSTSGSGKLTFTGGQITGTEQILTLSSHVEITGNLTISTKETKINTASITTTSSGNSQTYEGAVTLLQDTKLTAANVNFDATIEGEKNLEIGENALFKKQVGATYQPVKISISGTTKIETDSIKASTSQTYTNAVTLAADTNLQAPDVTFLSKTDGKQALTITGNAHLSDSWGSETSLTSTTFTGDLDAEGKTISITAELALTSGNSKEIKADSISFIGNFENTGSITNHSGATSVTGNFANKTGASFVSDNLVKVSGSVTNEGTATLTKGIEIAGDFTDSNGSWTSTTAPMGQITLNGSGDQNFNPNTATTYTMVGLEKTSGKTSFTGSVKINQLTDAAAYTGDILFVRNTNILTDTSFNTTGTVTFASEASNITTFGDSTAGTFKDITHTAGNTVLFGTFKASHLSFANTDLGTGSAAETTFICDNFTLSGDLTSSAATTGEKQGNWLKLTGNFTTSGTHTIAANAMLDGSYIGGGNTTFAKNLYLFTAAASPAPDIEVNSATITGDLIITADRNIATKGSITAGNLVLYKGNLQADDGSSLTSTKDTVLLGSAFNTNDPSRLSKADNDYYKYQQARTSGSAKYDLTGAAHMPDGTALPAASDYSGSYTAGAASAIKTEGNWYANGLALSGSSEWYIDLPDLTTGKNGFAESINCNVQNSTVRNSYMPAYECSDNGGNTNWIFEDFIIAEAHTERDNSIRITFNRPVRNTKNELINAINRFSNSSDTYAAWFTDADCDLPLAEATNVDYVFIKSENSWNTDATGKSEGTAASTDRSGQHKSVTPFINVNESTASDGTNQITDIWGKRLKYYDTEAARFTDVTDQTGPVLYSVRTGQERHSAYNSASGADSQPSYDGHNFIEFRYSEKVNFGNSALTAGEGVNPDKNIFDNSDEASSADIWLPAASATTTNGIDTQNVRVHTTFGALSQDTDIKSKSALKLTGLGIIEKGQLYTGRQGKADKLVNSLYRPNEYTIRLSIAGLTAGTVKDQNGNEYKNWVGYIEQAQQPAGAVTLVSAINTLVTDTALDLTSKPLYNPQILYQGQHNFIPEIVPYGKWDLSEPVFSVLRMAADSDWKKTIESEAIGNNSGAGSTLDKIEFHLFDNSPSFSETETPIWLTEKGWVTGKDSSTLYDASYTYAADILGGSNPLDADSSKRTVGGIRYSSIASSAVAFKYSLSQADGVIPDIDFDTTATGIYTGAKATLFTGSSTTRRSATDPDGLYFGVGLVDKSLSTETAFTVSYDDSKGFITDLAGNRLRSDTIRTVDRTPPAYDIILSPMNQKEMQIVFVKKLTTSSSDLKYWNLNNEPVNVSENYEEIIPSCFEVVSISPSGTASRSEDLQVDESIPAKVSHVISNKNKSQFTIITITLNKNITLKNLENLYIRVKNANGYSELSTDPLTAISNSRVTFIQDEKGNYMQMYTAHSLSDLAISSVNPLYAYDAQMSAENSEITNGLYKEGSWAVHDWTAEQQNYGTLPANHPLKLVADIDDGTEEKAGLPANGLQIFLSASPDKEAVSTQYNSDLNKNLRIWLPALPESIIAALSTTNNSADKFVTVNSAPLKEEDPSRVSFDISDQITKKWGSNQQISFLFGFLNESNELIRIYNSPFFDVSTNSYNFGLSKTVPLFAVRLANPADISSIDLWSFRTRAITDQRGGVTILNNVINAENGEKTILKINVPESSNLDIMVMTLDGNIITYLNHGKTEAGEHYYSWNGKNNNGSLVARGMYFIRIVGSGFDETRKVMVVK